MRRLNYHDKLRSKIARSKYSLYAIALVLSIAAPLALPETTAYAAQTFTGNPISSTYKTPTSMTVAGGALWYVESTSTVASDSIAKMTTSGTITDYNVGYPSGKTSFQIAHVTTGPDGNVWFDGYSNGPQVYAGYLDISTGAVTFYDSGKQGLDAPGPIVTGSDGKMYYYMRYSNNGVTYLLGVNPATGTTAVARTFTSYTNLAGLTSGPDGRLWATDVSAGLVYAQSVSGGTNSAYSTGGSTTYPQDITAGPDGNLWFAKGNDIVKMTTAGSMTTYTSAAGVQPHQLTAGPDGAVWFVDIASTPKIGRISTSGSLTEYTIPGSGVTTTLGGFALGPDDAMWFTYQNQIGSGPVTYGVGRLGY